MKILQLLIGAWMIRRLALPLQSWERQGDRMGDTVSIDKGQRWRPWGLGIGLLLMGLGMAPKIAAAPVDATAACTEQNTYTEKQLKVNYDGKLVSLIAQAYAQTSSDNGYHVICFKLDKPQTIETNLIITASATKPLVLVGLKTTGKGLTLSGSHVTLQNTAITVDSGAALTMTGSHHTLSNVTLTGTKQAGSYGVQASGATHVVIEDSTLENFDRGIVVGGQSQITNTIVRWHYEEFPPAGMAATGTEALQLLGTTSVVTGATVHGYATGIALSDAGHVIKGSSVVAYPYKLPPTDASDEVKQALQEKLQQHPGLDGVLITGHGHQLVPRVTEVDGKKIETRNTIVGFATGIYLDGSATIRDNDITAFHVGIQSDTVPTQASVLYPNRFFGEKLQPYVFAEAGQPTDLASLKIGKVCTIETVWTAGNPADGTIHICDESAAENLATTIGIAVPSSYCLTDGPVMPIALYQRKTDGDGQKKTWAVLPRGWCQVGAMTQQAYLVKGESHTTIAAGTCAVQCTHHDEGEDLRLDMDSFILPVLFSNQGAYPLVASATTVTSLYNFGMKNESTVPGVGVTMTPTGGGEPGLVATGPEAGNVGAGGEISEVAAAGSEDEAAKAGLLDGSGFSGEATGSGLVTVSSGMKAGCSLVLSR